MASKLAFLFLAVCFIAMIDSGFSLECYQDCFDFMIKDGCVNGSKVICNFAQRHCATVKNTPGALEHRCLGDHLLSMCESDPNCHACKEDYCNEPCKEA